MHIQVLLTVILLYTNVLLAEESSTLPAVSEAESRYASEVKKADDDHDKHIDAAKKELIQSLQREMENQTKAGMLDNALAIRDRISLIKNSDHEPAALSDNVNHSSLPGDTSNGIKIPSVSWQPLGNRGIQSAVMLGPFPKGTNSSDIISYLNNGSFKKPYLGLSIQQISVDNSGNLNCTDQDNSEFYWMIYVKPSNKRITELIVTGQANPSDHTNSSELYVDGKMVVSGNKIQISATGSIIILRQIHNASYFNAWIRLLSDNNLLVAP